jgi:small subunit ribosomal protein S4e
MSKHLKRYFAPKTWKIKRKGIKYITKPSPGPHKTKMSLPINVVLRDLMNYADSNREVKFILEKKDITVDGIRRKNIRFPVGLFDVLSLNDTNEHFRVILDKMGKIDLIKIDGDEKSLKLCKITGKRAVKGKIQLNLYDGRNIFIKENGYKTGDSVLLTLGKNNQIKEKISLSKGVLVYLIGGSYMGQVGKVQDIIGNRVLYKVGSQVVETAKKDVIPIGKDEPLISITEK